MNAENQGSKKSTHVRVYPDKKERVEEIVRTLAFREKRTVYEIDILNEILERGLPKYERKLGIPYITK